MQSLSLVISECFLSGRGQGHVSNCGLRKFRHSSRRYTGDIHNSTVVGLFMKHWRRGVVVSGVRRMNEVNVRRARLLPGRVTVFGRVYHLGM